MKRNSIVLSLVLVVALVLAGCGLSAPSANAPVASATTAATTTGAAQTSYAPAAPASTSAAGAPVAVNGTVSALQEAFQNVYTNVNPSVVTINVVSRATVTSPFSRQSGQQLQQGLGSGFVWDTNGNIVTNNHVIEDADEITVVFYDGTEVSAKLVAADAYTDLAVVKVDVAADMLKPVRMGDSAAVKVGQLSIAIGNPYGEQNTMTTGIISALGRFMAADLNATGPTYQIPNMLQTDAPINPGNSGGVLLDVEGNVIGVTSAIESSSGSSAGIGFAIPTQIVNKVIPALISNGAYAHPYLGMSGSDLTPALATAMNLAATQRGALVATVTSGGPAATGGLLGSTTTATVNGTQTTIGGDVIVAIDGQKVKTFNDVISYLAVSTKVGQKVTLSVLRDGKQVDVTVTLGERPSTTAAATNPTPASQRSPYRTNPNQTAPVPDGTNLT
jgi:2-alkenal reductase